jgi:hypothetical protein
MAGRRLTAIVAGMGAATAVGCGPKVEAEAPESDVSETPRARPASRPTVMAEIGALPEDAVQKTFKAVMPEVGDCLEQGRKSVYFLAGMLEVEIRVAADGTARWVFPKRSTLGHRATETCIIRVLETQPWPQPVGGQNGLATQHFEIETSERPPVAWSPKQLGKERDALEKSLEACRRAAGSGGLSLTMYVDIDGKAMAAGGAAIDEQGRAGIDCAVTAAMDHTYASPGSYPAKVTLKVR